MDGSLVLLTSGPRRDFAPKAAMNSVIQGWRSLLVAGLALTLAACASPSVPTPEPEAQPPVAGPTLAPAEDYEPLTEPLRQFEEEPADLQPQPLKVGLLLPPSAIRSAAGRVRVVQSV